MPGGRVVAISVTTSPKMVTFVSYDNDTEEIFDSISGGFGEWSSEFRGTISTPTQMVLTHNPTGRTFGGFTFDEVAVCAVDGVGTGATTLQEIRDTLAAYLFSSGGGGYTYSLTRLITSAEIKAAVGSTGFAEGLVLATAPEGKQFDWRLLWKLTPGGTPYTAGGDIQIKIGTIVVGTLDVEHVTSSEDRANSVSTGYNIGEYKAPAPKKDFLLYTPAGEFQDGDGTVTVTLLYNLF